MAKLCIVFAIILNLFFLTPAGATDAMSRGLYISPLRKDSSIDAGSSKYDGFTVANLTDSPMIVTLSVKKFSVSNYSYDYTFNQANDTWIKLDTSQITLQPNESKTVPYTLSVPAKTAPGGYYYTIFASTIIATGSLSSTLQAATLLYVTVNGDLVRTSVLQDSSIPWLITSNEIPYQFDIKDTGNVHFSAYFYGQLQGLFTTLPESGTSHLVMPGTPRTITGSIPSPFLPGIYKATYGYKVDFSSIITTKSSYILFIPPWSMVAFVLLLLIGKWLWQRKTATQL